MNAPPPDYAHLFVELGCAAVGLAFLARLARRLGLSAISLYLLAGLAFGNGGLLPLNLTKDFIQLGAEIGVLLLLFMLGLEYSGENLTKGLRRGASGAAIDLALNFPPGFVAGLLLGWSPLASVLLGGITLVTSSGIVARLLTELKRMDAPETPAILSILVLEDLMMAVYLPLVAVLLQAAPDVFLALQSRGHDLEWRECAKPAIHKNYRDFGFLGATAGSLAAVPDFPRGIAVSGSTEWISV